MVMPTNTTLNATRNRKSLKAMLYLQNYSYRLQVTSSWELVTDYSPCFSNLL